MRSRNVGKCLAWFTHSAPTSSVWLRHYGVAIDKLFFKDKHSLRRGKTILFVMIKNFHRDDKTDKEIPLYFEKLTRDVRLLQES